MLRDILAKRNREVSPARPPKVVHVVVTYRFSGTERIALELMRHASRRGWGTGIVIPPSKELDELERRAKALGASVARIGPLFEGERDPVANFLAIRRFLTEQKADVVHLHMPWAPTCFEAILAVNAARVPICLRTEHNPILEPLPTKQWLKLALLDNLVDAIVCVSTGNRDRHVKNGRRPFGKMRVVTNGIQLSPNPTSAPRRESRIAMGLPADKLIAVMVGALEERKGVLDFVKTAHAVADRSDIEFAVLGDGPLLEQSRGLAAELGVADRVHFLGRRDDVPKLLPIFDIYVQPSHHEGLSVAMLEALAAGLPLVSTDVDGVSDVFPEGEGVFVRPVGDIAGLASDLAALANDPPRRAAFSAFSQARVLESFTADAMCASYMSLYDELLSRR